MTLKLHHVALKARNVETLSQFYKTALELKESARHLRDDGSLRSVWLDLGGTILMIEALDGDAGEDKKLSCYSGWHLGALGIAKSERKSWEKKLLNAGVTITAESPYSLYFRDPEGNRLALSHYPEKI